MTNPPEINSGLSNNRGQFSQNEDQNQNQPGENNGNNNSRNGNNRFQNGDRDQNQPRENNGNGGNKNRNDRFQPTQVKDVYNIVNPDTGNVERIDGFKEVPFTSENKRRREEKHTKRTLRRY
jgi:hypothetical protein